MDSIETAAASRRPELESGEGPQLGEGKGFGNASWWESFKLLVMTTFERMQIQIKPISCKSWLLRITYVAHELRECHVLLVSFRLLEGIAK